MSKAGEQTGRSSILTRTEQVQEQIHQFSARDLQLWSIGLVTVLLLTALTFATVLPNVMWGRFSLKLDSDYLPQVLFGLISFVLLFNIYLLGQKSSVRAIRQSLVVEMALNERLESLSQVDPVTQLMNARGMALLIPKEVARANRLGTNLTFMKIDLSGFPEMNTKSGIEQGNTVLTEFGTLLKAVFRGGDVVFRQQEHEFLIVLPDTREDQTDPPLQRLLASVEHWNLNSGKPYEISFKWAFAQYPNGGSFEDALRGLDRKVFQAKNKLVPVF